MPEIPLTDAITPDLPIMDSLIMEDEHIDTIPEMESDKVIKSSVENLIPIPSESEDFSDIESECDVPICDDSSPSFTTFSNPLFDSNDDFTLSDDESLFDEDVLKENFKIYSNPLFDEEIISTKIDPHHFNAESDLIKSLLNRDTSIGINETNFDPEEEIRLIMKLLYDSSPHPPEELNSEISDATIESSSPSPIPVEDSDSLMEEINLFLDLNDSIPQGIENDDYDSEGDILFLKNCLAMIPFPFPKLIHFTLIIMMFRHPLVLLRNNRMMEFSLMLSPIRDIDTLLPFSFENEDKVFNPGILSSPLLSHQGKITSDFFESLMMISRGNIPLLDVPYLHPP
ncbi:hypothetical protein Tco_0992085 [Tanacetum coccineum]|uniref:Uncharacterized protein n=1 Tax=Tanacetum coccineum TaxID=301880 RepID=A0ABQ5F155_9ASTR